MACTFQVDFYNYGYGDYWADVNFALQSPTKTDRTISVASGDSRVPIGRDRPGGGTDLDGEETYTLGFTGAAHPKQGYHVKLTIDAPYSHGARVKHKVFWVRPCPPAAPGDEMPRGGEIPGGGGGEVPGGGGGEVPGGGGGEVPGGGGGEVPGGEAPGGEVPGGPGQREAGGGASAPAVSPTTRTGSAAKRTAMAEEIGVFGAVGPARSAEAAARARPGAVAKPETAAAEAAPSAAVPTAVEAGVPGDGSADPGIALSTSLLGLCGLLAAAVAVTAYRSRGAH